MFPWARLVGLPLPAALPHVWAAATLFAELAQQQEGDTRARLLELAIGAAREAESLEVYLERRAALTISQGAGVPIATPR